MLAYTAEVLVSFLAQYNRAVWPAPPLATALALAVLALAWRPAGGVDRLIGALLAAAWAWVGLVFYLLHFATLDFAAPAYGLLFLVQALLLAWAAAFRGQVGFRRRRDAQGWAGLGLALLALAGEPALAWLAGRDWQGAPMVGVAPGPTVLFTLALLVAGDGRTPPYLAAIPLLWALTAGFTAWRLGTPERLILPAASLAALGLVLWNNRRRTAA